MQLALIVLAILATLELLLYAPLLWRIHKQLSLILLFLNAASIIFLLIERPVISSVIIALFSIYRIINLNRIYKERIQGDYLYNSALSASLWLLAFTGLVLTVSDIIERVQINLLTWLMLAAAAQIVLAGIFLMSTLRCIKKTKLPVLNQQLTSQELPTLSVAVPARNETRDLEECLSSLVVSSYPKLEIIVLDDCSQNKRTPEIIRSYAQSGVRFIAGQPPPRHWLAKNYAYKQLAESANGQLILFCGVDVRFESNSLSDLVETLILKHKSMVCLMPTNEFGGRDMRQHFIQPMRYAWEFALPRKLFRRPPALSTCWLINRVMLDQAGNFAAVSRSISPESYFARKAASFQDGYSFVRSDKKLGIRSQKSFIEQRSTAIRTRYPQLHKRLELAAIVSLMELFVIIWPLFILPLALASQTWLLAGASALGYVTISGVYAKMLSLTYGRTVTASICLFPLVAIYDIVLLNYSMWQYEFNEVDWKGRNICIPVMRAGTDFLSPAEGQV